MSILSLRNITKTYEQGGVRLAVLHEISLAINKGESVALVGPSGCGKSTLLQIAGLLQTSDSGEVLINGRDTARLSDYEKTIIRRREIGFIYQFHHLLPEFTALENITIPQMINGARKKDADKKSTALLERVNLTARMHHRPSELSGGEQQRVAIARALANNPALLLADEPTGNLDPHTAESVFKLFADLVRDIGLATLIVTHNHDLAARMDRVITL